MSSRSTTATFVFLALLLPAPAVHADSSEPPARAKRAAAPGQLEHDRGVSALEAGQFSRAVLHFRAAHRADRRNADYLNMFAYSLRKTGDLDGAFEKYGAALKLRPKFPEAREYLGEAHLQAVLREIETLRSYGPSAQPQLRKLVDALRRASSQVGDDGALKGESKPTDW